MTVITGRLVLAAGALACLALACAPPKPTAIPLPTPTPVPPTANPSPTATPNQGQAIEGLLLRVDGQWIIGVDWTSRSRITLVVLNAEESELAPLLGETVRVEGQVVEHSPWKKDITLLRVEPSSDPARLSLRTGLVKELGVSVYMQGTHKLVDDGGELICLLSGRQHGVDLNGAMGRGQVNVFGVLSPTVEGNAQIMEVQLIEPIE